MPAAIHVLRGVPRGDLSSSGRATPRDRGWGQLPAAFELALAVVLLTGVGLMVETMERISEIPLGFDPGGVELLGAELDRSVYALGADNAWTVRPERLAAVQDLIGRVQALPRAEAVAASTTLPMRMGPRAGIHLGDPRASLDLTVDGEQEIRRDGIVYVSSVTPDYFRVMGIDRILGRTFLSSDGPADPPVAVVNRALVEELGVEDPVGTRMLLRDGGAWRPVEIVGVVADEVRGYPQHRLADVYSGPQPSVYVPYSQPNAGYSRYSIGPQLSLRLSVRHRGDAEGLQAAMREAFRSVDSSSPVTFQTSMEDFVAEALVDRRFHLWIVGFLATVSLLLSLAGMYGLTAYRVGQRRHEIGVRMALGAHAEGVARMIIADGLRVAVLGVVLGVAGAMASTGLLANWLYGVAPTEPLVFVGVAVSAVSVTVLASWVPAREAASVDPLRSLAAE